MPLTDADRHAIAVALNSNVDAEGHTLTDAARDALNLALLVGHWPTEAPPLPDPDPPVVNPFAGADSDTVIRVDLSNDDTDPSGDDIVIDPTPED